MLFQEEARGPHGSNVGWALGNSGTVSFPREQYSLGYPAFYCSGTLAVSIAPISSKFSC
jgi:hypothetical protein